MTSPPITAEAIGRIKADVDYITAALSWYDGGPASDDVRAAWTRLTLVLAANALSPPPEREGLIREAREWLSKNAYYPAVHLVTRLADAIALPVQAEGLEEQGSVSVAKRGAKPPLETWRPMASAPRDGTAILAWGALIIGEDDQATPRGARRAVIYWDQIDDAWCCSTHPWDGPFFEPVAWTDLPEVPSADDRATWGRDTGQQKPSPIPSPDLSDAAEGWRTKVRFAVTAYDEGGYGDNRSQDFTSGEEAVAYARGLEARFHAVVDKITTADPLWERLFPAPPLPANETETDSNG